MSVETNWGVFRDVYCPGKEKTFEFLQNVLNEVCELFPSHYIHIGGDEVPKYNWKHCPDCQKRIKEEGLKDENELQGYVTQRIEKFLLSKGRSIIGWDEILEGGVTPTAIVQSWRGMDGAVVASKMGNKVISSPVDYTYFFCPQVKEEVNHSDKTINILNTLERVYSFEPVPKELTPEQASSVMGGECCMWDEYTYEFEVDPQIFPRLCALCEVLWSPAEKRDFTDFSGRLQTHYSRLDALGVDYYKPEIRVGGWTEDQVNNNYLQLCWDVTKQVTQNGIYRISVVPEKGDSAIYIQWVALYQDNKEIARHARFNRSDYEMYLKYPLRVTTYQPGSSYTLRVCMGGKRENDTTGSIYLRYFKDTGVSIP
jgi:N-acetyl-beta-hexosaminidase